jgi:hypothetical protein
MRVSAVESAILSTASPVAVWLINRVTCLEVVAKVRPARRGPPSSGISAVSGRDRQRRVIRVNAAYPGDPHIPISLTRIDCTHSPDSRDCRRRFRSRLSPAIRHDDSSGALDEHQRGVADECDSGCGGERVPQNTYVRAISPATNASTGIRAPRRHRIAGSSPKTGETSP